MDKAPLSAGLRFVLTKAMPLCMNGNRMTLDEYLKATKTSQAEMAEEIGVEQSTICRICQRGWTQRLDIAFKIEEYTLGQVKAKDLIQKRRG